MSIPKRTAAVAAAVVAASTAVGYALGGAAAAAQALLASALLVALALLWRRLDRDRAERAEAAAAIEERIASLAERVDRAREAQEAGLRELSRRSDRTVDRIDRLPEETRGLLAEADRAEELLRRLDAVAEGLERLPRQTRNAVREWSRVVYGEVEDLAALYQDIRPDRALPPMHGWAAGADLARFVYLEVAERGRARVLECGSGSTTVVLAYAARARGEGHVTSLEHDPRYAEATRTMLRERGLSDWAEVVDAPLTEVRLGDAVWNWYDTSALPDGPIDLLLVDGPPAAVGPRSRYPALPLLADRLAADAIVLLDDARRPDERAIGERWVSEFDEFEHVSLAHDHGTSLFRRREPGRAG